MREEKMMTCVFFLGGDEALFILSKNIISRNDK